jgi:hypothetical protein
VPAHRDHLAAQAFATNHAGWTCLVWDDHDERQWAARVVGYAYGNLIVEFTDEAPDSAWEDTDKDDHFVTDLASDCSPLYYARLERVSELRPPEGTAP